MQKIIFQPKYSLKGLWDVTLISLLLFVVLVFSFIKFGFDFANIIGLIFLIGFVGWHSRDLIRYIVFSTSSFCVERYIGPSKTINYSEVIDLGRTKVKTQQGEISFAGMSNWDELLNRFKGLIEQGKIDTNQLENKVVVDETILHKTILPSIVIISVLFLIMQILGIDWLRLKNRQSRL